MSTHTIRCISALSILCLTFTAEARANSFRFEGIEGQRCSIVYGRQPELNLSIDGGTNNGYDTFNWGGANSNQSNLGGTVSLRIPLSNPVIHDAEVCRELGIKDNNRTELRFLQELHDQGLITDNSFIEKAADLGYPITLESEEEASGFAINLQR